MAIQSTFKAAFTTLRKSFARDKKKSPVLNRIHDAFNALEEDALPKAELVERTTRLAQVLSESVPLLHKSRARPTLAFCGSAIAWLYETKLKPAVKSEDKESVALWEETMLNGLIQPILEISSSEDEDAEIFGETVYPAICKAMRSSCASAFGGRFARSLALVLLDSCSIPENKSLLLDQNVFGVPALSKLIIDARDYHHLDTLLELSFNIFSSQNGTTTRESYAKALFETEYAALRLPREVCVELARIHAVTSGSNSEQHVLDIIRALSSVQVQRPQVFSTQGLSYCGTKYTQRPPSNIAILDNSSVSVIICDKDDETDVLIAPFASIEKIELTVQDASRTLVKYMVSEAPLIFSIRAAVETPTSHTTGTALCLCVSIASSDVLDFETALAARNLANKVTGDAVITRRVSTLNTKVSNAASQIGLSRAGGGNLSQERVDEMMSKYVNMPSSPDSDPAPAPVAPKRPGPKKPTNASARSAKAAPEPPPKPPAQRETNKTAANASKAQPAPPVGRLRRACATRAAKVIQKQALELSDNSDHSEPEVTPEQPRRTGAVQNLAAANDVLPTPPETRQTKPAAKILVPGSPVGAKTRPKPLSSPISEITSPTAKIVSKRKRVEEDPIEPSVDAPDREDDQPQKVLPSSQYITPRNTAATRAKAKYTTNAKKMRVSSPDPESEVDTRKSPPLFRTDVDEGLVRSELKDPGPSEEVATEAQPPSNKCNSTARSTRSTATSKKSKAVVKAAPTTGKPTADVQHPESGNAAAGSLKGQKDESTPQVGHTLGEEQRQEDVALVSERVTEGSASPKSSTPVSSPLPIGKAPARLKPLDDIEFVDVDTISVDGDAEVKANDTAPSSQGDELLAALSRVAQKATRRSLLKPEVIQPRLMSPIEVAASADDHTVGGKHAATTEDVGLDAPETLVRQTRARTTKTEEKVPLNPTTSKALPIRQQVSVEPKKVLEERSAPKADVPQPSKIRQAGGVAQTGKISANEYSSEDTEHSGGRETKENVRPPSSLRGDKTKQKGVGPSKAMPPSDHTTPPVIETDVREALELPEGSTSVKPGKAIGRIHGAPGADVAPAPLPPAEIQFNQRLANSPFPVTIDLGDADSEVEELLEVPVAKPTFHPISQKTPTSVPFNSQPKVALQAPARIKLPHDALSRITQPPRFGLKSALASPRKTASCKGRPSVSFVDRPSLARRRSSDSSATYASKHEQRGATAESLAGASPRTGSVIMQIVEVLGAIQTTIVENLGEKVQTVTTDARNARAELAQTAIAKLDAVRAQAERHYNALHEFEGIFATQTQEFLDGCNRVDKCNARIDTQAQEVMARNARVGQHIAKTVVDFELPEGISTYLVSN